MFAHIFFLYHPELNKGGIFGYEYWSVFFTSFMFPVLFFDFAYLWQRVSNTYIHDVKGKKISNILVGTFYFFSLFYLCITIFPYKNSYSRIGLNPAIYYVIAAASAIAFVFIIIYLPKRILRQKQILQAKLISAIKAIRFLNGVLYSGLEDKGLINPWKEKEFKKYRINISNKVVDYEEEN